MYEVVPENKKMKVKKTTVNIKFKHIKVNNVIDFYLPVSVMGDLKNKLNNFITDKERDDVTIRVFKLNPDYGNLYEQKITLIRRRSGYVKDFKDNRVSVSWASGFNYYIKDSEIVSFFTS